MEASEIQRLREEQDLAIQTTNDEIDKWKKLDTDYKNLSDRLMNLPNKISHEVMVPFGPMAFMPGQLVHTNEILVLLGENWFVERSAKQASEIVKRRKKAIEKQLDDLQQQKNLLVNRTGFTDEISQLSEGTGDIREINEKYDVEKEKEWKVQHRKNVKKYHEELRKKKQENPETDKKKEDDLNIWKRLDELEKLETERNELGDDDNDNDSKQYQKDSHPPPTDAQSPSQGKKSVRWFDEVAEDNDSTDSSGSESEEDSLNDKGTGNRENLGVIHFTHSPVEPSLPESTEEKPNTTGHLTISSPTDIYKYFMRKSPKSILKSPSFERELPQQNIPYEPVHIEQKTTFFEREKAFTEEVVEKVPQAPVDQNMTPAPENTSQPPKRMSKFKASRLQR